MPAAFCVCLYVRSSSQPQRDQIDAALRVANIVILVCDMGGTKGLKTN